MPEKASLHSQRVDVADFAAEMRAARQAAGSARSALVPFVLGGVCALVTFGVAFLLLKP